MKNRRVVFYIVVGLVGIGTLIALALIANNMINFQLSVPAAQDGDKLGAGYEQVKPDATEQQVIALMGAHFDVRKCPPTLPDANANPAAAPSGTACAHIWHYQADDGQAWDLQFDMDGNLMRKEVGTAAP